MIFGEAEWSVRLRCLAFRAWHLGFRVECLKKTLRGWPTTGSYGLSTCELFAEFLRIQRKACRDYGLGRWVRGGVVWPAALVRSAPLPGE